MKTIFLGSCNKSITFLLALLGFASACNDDNFRSEYGTPHAIFIVKGSILSEKDNQAIENIRVVLQDSTSRYNADTAYTDLEGNFIVKMNSFPNDQIAKIYLQDIDGQANGEFQPLDTIVEFKNPQFTGGDHHWYYGKTEKELNVKMKPKL